MPNKLVHAGLAALFCLLASCASTPERPVHTVIVPVPSELTQPVPEPQLQGSNNSALVDLIERLRSALGLANDRLDSIAKLGRCCTNTGASK